MSQTELQAGSAEGGVRGTCQLQDVFLSPMLVGAARQEEQEEARKECVQDASEGVG